MRRRQLSLTFAAPLSIGIIFAIIFGTFIFVGINMGDRIIRDRLIKDNRTLLSVSANLIFNPLYELDIWTLNGMLKEFMTEKDIVQATIRDIEGDIVTQTKTTIDEPIIEDTISQELSNRALNDQSIVQFETDKYLILNGPIAAGPENIGTLEIVFDLSSLRSSVRALFTSMLITGIATLFIAILLSNYLVRFIQRPINDLVYAAREIGQGNLDVEIPQIMLLEPATIGASLGQMRDNLKELYQNLEHQVDNLAQRTKYLEATSTVARDMASVLNLDELLERAMYLIDKRFDFYRQAIFLVDPSGEQITLQVATGQVVEQTMDQGFSLKVGKEGIVGYVASTGNTYVAQDVLEDPFFIADDVNIEVRSELALPLRIRGEVIGVLDVQSAEPNDFSDEVIAVMETLADQIALAITNARLFRQTQENLEAVREAYGELSREKWSQLLRERSDSGYYSDASGTTPVTGITLEEQWKKDLPEYDIPISIRGSVIGRIRAHKDKQAGEWTAEEMSLLETVSEQVSIALESARLFEDSQRRASQERVISEVSGRFRETLNVDAVLKTAVQEMRTQLGLSEVSVRLVPDPDDDTSQ